MAIASGIVVVIGMLGSHRMPAWTALFLFMTILTSATGFLFPINGFTQTLGVGVISLLILAVACFALYARVASSVAGVGSMFSPRGRRRCVNIFVLFTQSFPESLDFEPAGAA